MSTYLTSAILLKKSDYQEGHQLFSLYTKTHGKVTVLGRGTKKIKSKLNPHMQFFAVIDIMVARGKRFDQLAGAVMKERFSQFETDLQKISLGSYALDLVEALTEREHPDVQLYQLLDAFLRGTNDRDLSPEDIQLFQKHYIIKLLTLLGLEPQPEALKDLKSLKYFLHQNLERELKSDQLLKHV